MAIYFCFLWYVAFLFTNEKTCNREAVPSTWRNCLFFVALLGLGTAWGHHGDLFSLFMVCCYALPCILLTFPYLLNHFYHHYILLGVCMPVFCLLADHSSASFEVNGQKRLACKWKIKCNASWSIIMNPKKRNAAEAVFCPLADPFQCIVWGRWADMASAAFTFLGLLLTLYLAFDFCLLLQY